jgi:Cu-processing system permease protein
MTEPGLGEQVIAGRRAEAAQAASRSSRRLGAWAAAALFELRVTTRSRWVVAAAAAFAVAATSLSYFGLSAAGYAGFQGFERTATSLLSLILYLAPLLGLVLGLSAFASSDTSDLAFLLPSERMPLVLGRLCGLSAAAGAAHLIGLGAAGLAIAAQTGPEGLAGYLGLIAACLALTAVFVGLGAAAGLAAGNQLQASGLAVGAWVWLVFLYEVVLLGVLLLVPETSVRPLLLTGVFGSPVSLARVLTLLAIGADPVLGPAGALLVGRFGYAGSMGLLTAGLAAWVAAAWLSAAWLARRRD